MKATALIDHEHADRTDWFASWFDSPHYQQLYSHRDRTEAAAFVDRVATELRFARSASVLDLGCGNGRHARALADHGLSVTGIDLSPASLALARSRPRPGVRFIEQDMRQPFGTHAFDHVLSLFTSFGYFDDRSEHLAVVQNIARSLKPGGTLVLDYLNATYVDAHLVPYEVIDREGVRFAVTRWRTATAFFKHIVVSNGPRMLEFTERVARLTAHDFRGLFAECGLRLVQLFGSYELDAFDPATSSRLNSPRREHRRRAVRLIAATGSCESG